MSKEFINPPNLPNWEQAFSQIVVVPNGAVKTVHISGQVSVDKEKNLIGGRDLCSSDTSVTESRISLACCRGNSVRCHEAEYLCERLQAYGCCAN